jgi:hypothetical protein
MASESISDRHINSIKLVAPEFFETEVDEVARAMDNEEDNYDGSDGSDDIGELKERDINDYLPYEEDLKLKVPKLSPEDPIPEQIVRWLQTYRINIHPLTVGALRKKKSVVNKLKDVAFSDKRRLVRGYALDIAYPKKSPVMIQTYKSCFFSGGSLWCGNRLADIYSYNKMDDVAELYRGVNVVTEEYIKKCENIKFLEDVIRYTSDDNIGSLAYTRITVLDKSLLREIKCMCYQINTGLYDYDDDEQVEQAKVIASKCELEMKEIFNCGKFELLVDLVTELASFPKLNGVIDNTLTQVRTLVEEHSRRAQNELKLLKEERDTLWFAPQGPGYIRAKESYLGRRTRSRSV